LVDRLSSAPLVRQDRLGHGCGFVPNGHHTDVRAFTDSIAERDFRWAGRKS